MSDTVAFEEIHFQAPRDLATFDPESAARELLHFAVEADASDIFVTDESAYVAIRMRRMGRVEQLQKLSREAGRRLQNHFRAVGGADVTDHINPVEGRDVVDLGDDQRVDLRISALPSVFGQDLALRLFRSDQSLLSLDRLGLLDDELTAVRDLLMASSGLLLVAGPTDSGKTSTLYAFLNELNNGERKIHTMEDPIEFTLPGIVQSQVNVRSGVGYEQLLYTVLRHSPDVILLGEVRDRRTAEIAIQAACSGQLVLASVHARTAAGAIQTLAAYGVNRHFLASSLRGVIAQRLVRRLCQQCRDSYDISDLTGPGEGGTPAKTPSTLYVPVGCENCTDGYDRRICVPEILQADVAMRTAISDSVELPRIEAVARQSGMTRFRDSAARRLALGLTTAEELTNTLPAEETDSPLPETPNLQFDPQP